MTALVIAEHDNSDLADSALAAITAAGQLSDDISILVAGYDCGAVADAAAGINGVHRVYHAEAEHYGHGLAEELAPLVVSLAGKAEYIVAPATTFGKNLLPRAAAMLGVNQVADVVRIESNDTFVRPIYAGNALATVRLTDPLKVLTVRATGFEPAQRNGEKAAIETVDLTPPSGLSSFAGLERSESSQPALASARAVVAGGRGLGSRENFDLVHQLAGKLNAAVGATRAAVDAGYVPNDFQVGQTGKVIAPDLYIAVGISGAIQHLAGIKDSRCIVAINNDEDAPIFDIADYGLVADLFDVVPELAEKLGK